MSIVDLHPGQTKRVASLHERLMDVIDDYVRDRTPSLVTKAEVVGTLEFVKAETMELFK